MKIRETALRLVKSGAAGILATATDLGVLTLLVSAFHVSPVVASTPALVLGSIVMFLGQKYFVFEAKAAQTLGRELVLYVIVQAVGIALTTLLFKVVFDVSPRLEHYYVPVRLVVNNIVWLFYFFPLWHFVFKAGPAGGGARPIPIPVASVPMPEVDREQLDVRGG